jgi:hypothetical protein
MLTFGEAARQMRIDDATMARHIDALLRDFVDGNRAVAVDIMNCCRNRIALVLIVEDQVEGICNCILGVVGWVITLLKIGRKMGG